MPNQDPKQTETKEQKIEKLKEEIQRLMQAAIDKEKLLFDSSPTQGYRDKLFGVEPTVEKQTTRNIEV